VAGKPEWAKDTRFQTLADRKLHEDDLDMLIAGWSVHFAAHAIMKRLQSAGICAGMVQSVPDLFSCPQLEHREQWVKLNHPEFGAYEHEAPPFILSETPAEMKRSSPLLGEHNDYVFDKIVGLSPAEIQALKDEGVIA
jgi:crotonobetainyl-CoA:carnitine CoA-transferase CaiB-like acyl-CoA transferase